MAALDSADEEGVLRWLRDEHGPALSRYALSLTGGDTARAEDVVQETFLRAWRNLQAFEPDRGRPRAWLYAVARHVAIDDRRSAWRRHESATEHLPDLGVADETERVADREVVVLALRRLSAEHQQVLRECYYRGRSVSEAAEVLGVPPGTVKSRTHYALRALRMALDELGGVQ